MICTDGSADKLISIGLQPHIIIGDEDSTDLSQSGFPGMWIAVKGQDKSDLHKTLDWCTQNGVREISIVGSIGARDDHSLANIELLKEFSPEIKLTMITDFSTLTCHCGSQTFPSFKGQIVSLFGTGTISTVNLKYELTDKMLQNVSQGVSNESLTDSFTVESSDQVLIFRSHP